MDRLESEAMVKVKNLVDQDCTFSFPTNSLFNDVDLNQAFVQGGSTQFTKQYRLSNSQVCVTCQEKPFPVPTCAEGDDETAVIRSISECTTMFGITLDPEEEFEFTAQESSDWEEAEIYAGSPSYEYWEKLDGISEFLPYMNILNEVEIRFYNEPIGTPFVCSWVNGGGVYANTFNFANAYSEYRNYEYGCYIVIDGQDAGRIVTNPNDPVPIDSKMQNQQLEFIYRGNDQMEEWFHTYYVRPVPYRLTFQDLRCYAIDLKEGTEIGCPAPPIPRYDFSGDVEFDFDSINGAFFNYGSIDVQRNSLGYGGVISAADMYLENKFNIETFFCSVETLVIENESDMLVKEELYAEEVTVTNSQLRSAGSMTTDDGIVLENSLLEGQDVYIGESISSQQSTIRGAGNWKIEDSITIQNTNIDTQGTIELASFTAQFSNVAFDKSRISAGLNVSDLHSINIKELWSDTQGAFLRCVGIINKVYNYGSMTAFQGVSIEVDEWYGTLPGSIDGGAFIIGEHFPTPPPIDSWND